MFSPYYAWARQRHARNEAIAIDAENFCAINVALYGAGGKRWAMTERSRAQVQRDAVQLQIGPSALVWQGDALHIKIDERTVPRPARLRGEVTLHPAALQSDVYTLNSNARHVWRPIAPCARVQVSFDRPALRWQGHGYLDTNRGDAPLEDHFVRWDWSRALLRDGRCAVLYDAQRRDGGRTSLALAIDRAGVVKPFDAPAGQALPRTRWGIARGTRSQTAGSAQVRQTLEDTPFYARSLVGIDLLGERVTAMHESLSLNRFASPWVRCMLPFRMPRTRG